MISQLHLTTILIIFAIMSGFMLFINGVYVELEWLKLISATISCISILLLFFEHFAWRWRWLHGWFVKKPNLNGTWQIQLRSNWQDPNTGNVVPEKTCYLLVRQTYSHLSLRLITNESSSEIIGASIHCADDGLYRISGIYRNEPQFAVRSDSPIHYGAILLNVQGDPPTGLIGHYWTDRGSAGEFQGKSYINKLYDNFTDANNYFEKDKQS